MPIKRAFLTIGNRQVHYRHGGSGPTVILLHQSPKSSEELIPLMELLAPHFTVLAPDRPGYGLSDPIAPPESEPEIDVFADDIAEFMDGLGLTTAGFYGLHTGVAVASRFAVRYPGRVTALVANGTLIMDAAERSDFLAHYLPSFIPSWDGSHLAWVWSRMREQSIFFPWHKREPSARMVYGMTPENVQDNVMAFLLSGDNYRTGYRAALAHEKEQDIARLTVPARFVCAKNDVLYDYLVRFPALPADVAIERVENATAAQQFALKFLLERVKITEPAKTAPAAPTRLIGSAMVETSLGQIHIRGNGNASGRPILVVPDAGGSARGVEAIIGGISGRRPVFAVDLPGHGDSDSLTPDGGTILDAYARTLIEVLDALNFESVDIVTVGAGISPALTLAEQHPGRVAAIAVCNPFIVPSARAEEFARNYAPALDTDWAGAHLQRAWLCSRDKDLYWPWFDTTASAVLPSGVPASNARIQQRVIDLFKAKEIHAAYIAELAHDPVIDRLQKITAPVHLFATATAPARTALAGCGAVHTLPKSEVGWGTVILEALSSPMSL